MKKRIFLAMSLLAVVSLIMTACPGTAQSGKLIKIATQSPLSGGTSAIGTDIKNGVQLAIDQLSESLVKMGYKVEIAPFDDQGNPDIGVANAKSIVADPSILVVVGHYNSGVQIPSSEEYHAAGLANISPANTNPKVTDRGYVEVSRICGRDDVQGAVGAEFVLSKGFKTTYVVHDKTTYGQGIAQYYKLTCEKLGIKVMGFDGTEEKANFDSILTPILAAKPDVIYFGGMYDQAAVLFKQARQKGFKGMFLSDDGFDAPEAAKIAGGALVDGGGTYYSSVAGPANAYPGTKAFQEAFKAKFGSDPQPFAAQSYDCTAIALKAIETAIKASGDKFPARADVAAAIRAIKDFSGITGIMNFNGKGDLVKAKYFIIQVTSADPNQWSSNRIDQILDIAPPQ